MSVVRACCIIIPCGLKAADFCQPHWPEGRTHVSAKVRLWGERILVLDTLCRVPGRFVVGGPASFMSGGFVFFDLDVTPCTRSHAWGV